ncbi:unnamed protein product [Moneuplotes crassus]|uniref:Ankyrin repeat protein n=1 Tax=Euplotes crassus TaxID=5936 RepID=A0AAD2CX66_EUPCR|nr:unnamed protein product [Moneuplotes crassus]
MEMDISRLAYKDESKEEVYYDDLTLIQKIYDNSIKDLEKFDFTIRNLNFHIEHAETELDEKVTPLTAASYLGRHEIVCMILENTSVEIDLPTEGVGMTPLSAACVGGHYLVVKTLVENGADINLATSLDFPPMYYCFLRMQETVNMFENKNICCKIAEILLQAGADINFTRNGKTLLMKFCTIPYEKLNEFQKNMNLEIVKFLLEHGADKSFKTSKGETAYDLAEKQPCSKEIIQILDTIEQKYFYDNEDYERLRDEPVLHTKEKKDKPKVIIEENEVKVGCCSSFFSLCGS